MSITIDDPLSVRRLLGLALLSVALVLSISLATNKRIEVERPQLAVELRPLESKVEASSIEEVIPALAPEKPAEPVQEVKQPEVVVTPPEPIKPVVEPVVVAKPIVKPKPKPQGSVQQMIIESASKYGVSADKLLRIAKCESGFNPNAINRGYTAGGGHPTGLFQYLPETWTRYQRKLGVSGWNIYNPKHQADLTAFAFSIGGAGEWECR